MHIIYCTTDVIMKAAYLAIKLLKPAGFDVG